jgi:hypothetical protein
MARFKDKEYVQISSGVLETGDIVKSSTPNGSKIYEISKVSKKSGIAKISELAEQKFTRDINIDFRKIPIDDLDISEYKVYREVNV